MADELTDRLGLPIYTSGASQHPTREDFNARMELLEEAVAIARQGTSSDRPMPETRGTLFMETDTGLLWFDTGTEWIRVVRIGNDGPGRALNIDGPGSEGSSEWAARADHTHPLPLATGTESGAMGADDKALLDTATASATSNALARRNGSGQINVAGPTSAGHAAHKGYVDQQRDTRAPSSHTHNASDVNAGVLNSARLPAATQSRQGAMSAADKTKLDGATNLSTANRLVQRDSGGRANFIDPTSTLHAANKRYVDALHSETLYYRGTTTGDLDNHTDMGVWNSGSGSQPNKPVALVGTVLSFPRDDAGRQGVQLFLPHYSPAIYYRSWHGTDWNDWERVANTDTATSSSDGLMSSADKAKLDGATTSATGSMLMRRTSDGRVSVSDPMYSGDATNKKYVDGEISGHRHDASHVNSGTLHPLRLPLANSDSQGAMSRVDKRLLDTATNVADPSSLMRRNQDGNVSVETPSHPNHAVNRGYVETAVNAVSNASWNGEPGTLVSRAGSTGRISVGDPRDSTDAATKGYVDDATQDIRSASWDSGTGTLVRRASNSGRFKAGDPMDSDDAATKGYVDNRYQMELGGAGRDLNSLTQEGVYAFGSNGSDNVPESGAPGVCEVMPRDYSRVIQRVTLWSRGYRQYARWLNRDGSASGDWERQV